MLIAAALTAAGLALQQQDPDDVERSLDHWRTHYVKARVELAARVSTSRIDRRIYASLGDARHDLRDHHEGLQALCRQALSAESTGVANALIDLACVGRDGTRIDVARRPAVVRQLASTTLGRLDEPRAIHHVLETARGANLPDARDLVRQAAALRALAVLDLPVARPTIEGALEHREPDVRLAAADGLHALARPESLDALCHALASETDPRVAERLATTVKNILHRHIDTCDTKTVRRAVHAVCGVIGRTDWRADIAAIDVCAAFRSTAGIEPMIRVLERFREHPEDIDAGLLSGILRERAHEVLQELTGARIPATEPEQWRTFWNDVRDGFVLAKEPEAEPKRTRAGFFGIPVAGVRVVFVIDRSGSMDAQFSSRGETRFDACARELLASAKSLEADTKFNVVTFSNNARRWRSGFMDPSTTNLSSLGAKLRGTVPDGGTNIHAALELAMSIKSTRAGGSRYGSPVDEIFLLTDGNPTVGVIDEDAILEFVREANRHRRIRINTIAIGLGVNHRFLKDLAAQNDGRFIAR